MLFLIREFDKKKWQIDERFWNQYLKVESNFPTWKVLRNQMKNSSAEGVEKLDKVIRDRILLGNSLKL